MDRFTTDLYFEAHVTIEPVFDERLEQFKAIASQHGFRVADLLMKKRKNDTPERSAYDTFCTTRSSEYRDIFLRTVQLVLHAINQGFTVWRYKIENTLLDERMDKK